MTLRPYILPLFVGALLGGCNNNDSPQTPARKMGYGEAELLDPVNRPGGAVLPIGATAVLSLEAAGSSAAPGAPGDTGAVGYDEVWFDLEQPATLNMDLKEQDLQVVGRLELWDSAGGLHQVVDPNQLSAQVQLPAGRYGLRVHASHHQPHPVATFIRFTRQPLAGIPAARTTAWDLIFEAEYQGGCEQCDLSGLEFGGADLAGALLMGSNLSYADLGLVPNSTTATNLTNANLSGANLTNTKLAGANLSGANLTSANLDGADLTNVNLSGTNLTSANLNGAHLVNVTVDGTNFSLATWTFAGIQCALGSIDGCH